MFKTFVSLLSGHASYYIQSRRNILHTIKRRTHKWIGHSLQWIIRLNYVTEGKVEWRIEVRGRQRRWRKQQLDDLKEKRGYWKLKEEAVDCTVWRTGFGGNFGPVPRQTTEEIITKNEFPFSTDFFFKMSQMLWHRVSDVFYQEENFKLRPEFRE